MAEHHEALSARRSGIRPCQLHPGCSYPDSNGQPYHGLANAHRHGNGIPSSHTRTHTHAHEG
ncbi:hypothetical protein HMPREF1980_00310 [Actinomyces sp. oral taxon 172 str. F0311]|nr:hypothetical protein HMPREF1980_00310 [Actinomyces sp. oral taxon 172 str. F0311]